MSKYLIIFTFLSTFVSSQDKPKRNLGIGIEAGIVYPTLTHNLKVKNFPRLDTIYKHTSFTVRSTARVYYNFNKNKWGLNIFIGFASFGGKSITLPNGYNEQIIINAGEIGLVPHIKIKEFLRIGIGMKSQYFFRVWGKSYGFQYQPTTEPRKWQTNDITDQYKYFGTNAGLNVKYVYKHIIATAECWFGITNIDNSQLPKDFGTFRAQENNYRLLIGYEF